MKTTIIALIIIIILAAGGYFFYTSTQTGIDQPVDVTTEDTTLIDRTPSTVETDTSLEGEGNDLTQEPAPVETTGETALGTSAGGNALTAHHFGTGPTELLFVGGIHGGYSWNTALVAYQLIDYLEANPAAVPEDVRITVIPVANPDGLQAVTGKTGRFTRSDVPNALADRIPGRFNSNNVDLNRNFACDWQADAVWQDKAVSGGSEAFSEPESQALKMYIEANSPAATVVWYSAVGGVFSSNCHNGVLEETRTITNVYANASGYKAYEEFNYYEITGDMVNWLAKQQLPAISVLLTTHEDTEWEKNKAGIEALINHYSAQ